MQNIYPQPTGQFLKECRLKKLPDASGYLFDAHNDVTAADDGVMREHIRRVCEYRLLFYKFSEKQEGHLYQKYNDAVDTWGKPDAAARLMKAYGAVHRFSIDLNAYASTGQVKKALADFQGAVLAVMTEQGRLLDAPVFGFVMQAEGKNRTAVAFKEWDRLLKNLEMRAKGCPWSEVAKETIGSRSDERTGKSNAASTDKRKGQHYIKQTEEGTFPRTPKKGEW